MAVAVVTMMRALTSSAAFLTRSSAASSPFFPQRAPCGQPFSPPDGATSTSASPSSPRSSLRPARRFSLGYIGAIGLHRDLNGNIDGLFRSRALDSLEELDFYLGSKPLCPLPPSVLRFAPTLCVASIGGYDLLEINAGPALHLPRLKQLKLYGVSISEVTLQCLFASCSVLEILHLGRIHGLSTVRIISSTLRSFGVSGYYYHNAESLFEDLVIQDAPCLERLIAPGPFGGPRTIRVISAPKLIVLGCLSREISKVVLGTITVQVEQVFF